MSELYLKSTRGLCMKTRGNKDHKRNSSQLLDDTTSIKKAKHARHNSSPEANKFLPEQAMRPKEAVEESGRTYFPTTDKNASGAGLFVAPVHIMKVTNKTNYLGLFTEILIPAEKIISEYTGKITNSDNYGVRTNFDYIYETTHHENTPKDKRRFVDATNKGSEALFANHSDDPNATYEVKSDGRVLIKSLREINPTAHIPEQITVSYGDAIGYTFQQKIANQSHHNWRSPAQQFEYDKYNYLHKDEFSTELLNAIQKIINLSDGSAIFIPISLKMAIDQIPAPKNITVDMPFYTGSANTIRAHNKRKGKRLHAYVIEDESVFCKPAISYTIDEVQQEITALMVAAYCNDIQTVNYLLKQGAKINRHTADFRTALHFALSGEAIDSDKKELLEILLKNKNGTPDISIANNENETVIHYCIKHGLTESLKLILLHQKNLAFSSLKLCPIQYAFKSDQNDIGMMLLQVMLKDSLQYSSIR